MNAIEKLSAYLLNEYDIKKNIQKAINDLNSDLSIDCKYSKLSAAFDKSNNITIFAIGRYYDAIDVKHALLGINPTIVSNSNENLFSCYTSKDGTNISSIVEYINIDLSEKYKNGFPIRRPFNAISSNIIYNNTAYKDYLLDCTTFGGMSLDRIIQTDVLCTNYLNKYFKYFVGDTFGYPYVSLVCPKDPQSFENDVIKISPQITAICFEGMTNRGKAAYSSLSNEISCSQQVLAHGCTPLIDERMLPLSLLHVRPIEIRNIPNFYSISTYNENDLFITVINNK